MVSSKGEDVDASDDPQRMQMLEDLRDDTERLNTPAWHDQMVDLARELFDNAVRLRPVNLVSEIILPWSTTIGLLFSGGDSSVHRRLRSIAARLSLVRHHPTVSNWANNLSASVANACVDWRHRRAESDLDRLVRQGKIQVGRFFYVACTNTLPSFMAKAWLALLLHPDQLSLLRDTPRLLPCAVEEMIRYGGLVRNLHRRASREVTIGDTCVAAGDLLSLSVETANRDPHKYGDPERFDITRHPSGNLALGAGSHACPGASIVRLALTLTTPLFLRASPTLSPDTPILWEGGSTIRWPSVVPVQLHRQPKDL